MADNPQINISSLDFESFKSSFKEYLKTKPEFADYNYDGSAINSLLDVFAYNTMFYAYYANMIANEMFLETAQLENNVVSLLKPLGILLPGRSCAIGEITGTAVGSSSTFISYTDYLVGTSSSGLTYRFYTIEDVALDTTQKTFKVYQGSTVVKDLKLNVDTTEQKAFIANKDLDIKTIRIKVTSDGVESTWSLYDNTKNIGPDAKVFFIDRTSAGFYILFGKRTINDLSNNYGKNIKATDTVKISYLIPVGDAANNVTSYGSNNKVTIKSVISSAGGRTTPDLDLYRYSAPKTFAANDRAVTRDDYYGLLLNSGQLPSNIDTAAEINVWGGEEANPPAFGRVFISFADEGLTAGSYAVKNSINYIKNKSILTILPEYIQPQEILANIDLTLIGSTVPNSSVKTVVNNYYNTTPKFNNKIIFSEIKEVILAKYTITGININKITLSLSGYGSATPKNFYFKNQFQSAVEGTNSTVVKSDSITYLSTSVTLGDYPTLFDSSGNSTEGHLFAYKVSDGLRLNSNPVGRVDYVNGVVTVYPNVFSSTTKTKLTVVPKYPDTLLFNNEFLLKVNTTVNGV